MVMKLYGVDTPNVRRALLALYEKEVDDVEYVKVNILDGGNRKPSYLTVQPFGKVPALEDGDFQIFESRAIARYIIEKYEGQGTPDLFGKTLQEQAIVNQWVEVEGQNFNPPAADLIREHFFSTVMKRPLDKELIVSTTAKLEKVLDVYEAQLSKNKYLAGDHYTLADLLHIPVLDRIVALQGECIASRKHVDAWHKDIAARHTWKKTLEKGLEEGWSLVHLYGQSSLFLTLLI